MTMISKKCKDCLLEKELSLFRRGNQCRKCENLYLKRLREKTGFLEKQKKYRKGKGKSVGERYTKSIKRKNVLKKYKLNNPLKYTCRNILNAAIRDKKILKQPCKKCGDTNVHGHHTDYTKPLKVIWLCANHHVEIHKKINK